MHREPVPPPLDITSKPSKNYGKILKATIMKYPWKSWGEIRDFSSIQDFRRREKSFANICTQP